MRHVLGLLTGLVVTAVLLPGAGWAVTEAGTALFLPGADPPSAWPESGPSTWVTLGVMAGIGLVVGLVVAGRASPLATFVPSMVLLAWSVVYALDARRAIALAPADPALPEVIVQAGRGMGVLLATGVYTLLGVMLFLPALMPSRWSSRPHDEEEYADEEY
ncbi:hypothetical protein ACLQ2R_37010 [Streptosporangium sp. DT93]|uniref:hypothetical protein n=1 Tax=Streptosporangium sp. DT93 TaxID=3393428 RepID=UPI003CF433FC